MAITLTISAVDKTRQIVADSLRVENILTSKRDVAQFSIVNNTGDTYKPNLGAEVILLDGATKVFGGVITEIESVASSFAVITHKIKCQDYTRILDHRLVSNTFTGETVDSIIASLKTQYFPTGFTINNVDAPVVIEYVAFNYKPLAECIKQLAEVLNYDWYVDYDRDLHFFAKETTEAPFSLTDDNGKYYYDSLIIRRDNSQVRNSIVVRGGEYIGSQLTTEIETNGVDDIFPLPYKFDDFAATLTGQALSIGVDYLNDEDDYDALYNFQEKIIKFKSSDTPSSGSILKVSGKPHLPVIIRYRSEAHIATMATAESSANFTSDGVYEYLVKDSSINSREGAIQRAQAEITAYAETLSEGEFLTEESGLRAGMTLRVQSDSRGMNDIFVINKVTTVQRGPSAFLYQISLITTRTMDLISVLQRLILQSTNDLAIGPNDITDVFIGQGDEAEFSDSLGTFSSHGVTYRYGPSSDTGIWNQALWS